MFQLDRDDLLSGKAQIRHLYILNRFLDDFFFLSNSFDKLRIMYMRYMSNRIRITTSNLLLCFIKYIIVTLIIMTISDKRITIFAASTKNNRNSLTK